MSILWCGGEEIDFAAGTSSGATYANTGNRAGYARGAVYDLGPGWAKSAPFPGGPVTSCWFSFRYNNPIYGNVRPLVIGRSGTTAGICIGSNNQTTQLLSTADGTNFTVLASEATPSLSGSQCCKMDAQIINFGANTTINVYTSVGVIGGLTPAITWTGDARVGGITALDQIFLSTGAGGSNAVSEIIVADEDTRTFSVVTLAPNAAGDASAWTGAYTDIGEVANNDATVMYSNAAGQDAQVNLSNLPAGTFTIKGVKLTARACRSTDASISSVALGVKTNGSIAPGTLVAQQTVFASMESYLPQNPITANVWQPADINNLQINLRSAA